MIWIAAVLAIFLFYKFVEKKHKIILFKISGVILALACVGAGVLWAHSFVTDRQKNSGIEVSYSYHSSKLPKERKVEIANTLFAEFVSENPEILNLSADEQIFIKNLLYTEVFFESETQKDVLGMTEEESSLWIKIITEEDSKKKAQLEKRELELEKTRLSNYLNDLSTDRDLYSSDARKHLYRYKLHARKKSFTGSPKLVQKYTDAMLPWEVSAVESIEGLIERQSENYRKRLSKENEDSELSINICNNRKIPLNSYSFYVSGFEYGRSTPHALTEGDYGDETRLHGDIIIPPEECSTITWTNKYNFYDRYEISSAYGTWEK